MENAPFVGRAESDCSHGPLGRLPGAKKSAQVDRPQAGGYKIYEIVLGDSLASVWPCQVKRRSDRHDSCRINVSVRHVVMALDVIEIDRVGNVGLLI